jgi:hypothetical protein
MAWSNVANLKGATGADGADGSIVTTNAQTGTAYTLVLTDKGKLVSCTNAAAITVTVPPNSEVAFATGSIVYVGQAGAGQVTVAAGAGVTINKATSLKTRALYSMLALIKTGTDTWWLTGDQA